MDPSYIDKAPITPKKYKGCLTLIKFRVGKCGVGLGEGFSARPVDKSELYCRDSRL